MMNNMGSSRFLMSLSALFVVGQALWRYDFKSRQSQIETRAGVRLLKTFDIRNADLVLEVIKKRESDDFKSRVRHKQHKIYYWPGLKAMQISWLWMQTLNGLHTETSFQGDYSWLFSKLDLLSRSTPAGQDLRGLALAPFFLVIGADGVGSTLLVRDWIRRYPNEWKTWFFSGYHALENLKIPKLAADYFERGLRFSQTPDYVAALVMRLRLQNQVDSKMARAYIFENMDPEVLERIKRSRPEWFQE